MGESVDLARVGAWGQLVALALAVPLVVAGMTGALYAVAALYLVVTVVGIAGIVSAEDVPVTGPLIYPFVVPGFVPLYYFATRYDVRSRSK